MPASLTLFMTNPGFDFTTGILSSVDTPCANRTIVIHRFFITC